MVTWSIFLHHALHMYLFVRIYIHVAAKLIQLVNTQHRHPGGFHRFYGLQLHLAGSVISGHVSGVCMCTCVYV